LLRGGTPPKNGGGECGKPISVGTGNKTGKSSKIYIGGKWRKKGDQKVIFCIGETRAGFFLRSLRPGGLTLGPEDLYGGGVFGAFLRSVRFPAGPAQKRMFPIRELELGAFENGFSHNSLSLEKQKKRGCSGLCRGGGAG